MVDGGVADLSFPKSKTRRGRVQRGGRICPTLTASNFGIYRIYEIQSEKNKVHKSVPKKSME